MPSGLNNIKMRVFSLQINSIQFSVYFVTHLYIAYMQKGFKNRKYIIILQSV